MDHQMTLNHTLNTYLQKFGGFLQIHHGLQMGHFQLHCLWAAKDHNEMLASELLQT